MLYHSQHGIRLYLGDVRDELNSLPAMSVHCCVTSIPYWSLRDYKISPSVWGGDPGCAHKWGEWQEQHDTREDTTSGKMRTSDQSYGGDQSRRFNGNHQKHTAGTACSKCGAWLGNWGLEPTPDLYIANTVEVFRHLWRVMRDDSVVWLNIGDSYASGGRGSSDAHVQKMGVKTADAQSLGRKQAPDGYKERDLLLLPHLVARALQRDGWYCRMDNVWHKPNPMPESIQGSRWESHRVKVEGNWIDCPGCPKCSPNDGLVYRESAGRPTKAHEYIFQLTKSPSYYYDHIAVSQPVSVNTHLRLSQDVTNQIGSYRANGGGKTNGPMKAVGAKAALSTIGVEKHNGSYDASVCMPTANRNLRSVWTIATEPFSGAHFACFPRALVELCVLAGTSARGCCPQCGKQWARVLRPSDEYAQYLRKDWADYGKDADEGRGHSVSDQRPIKRDAPSITADYETLGWRQCCKCPPHQPVPCTVLDICVGSGTTAEEAKRNNRDAIGIDISEEYLKLAIKRLEPLGVLL